MTANAAIDLFDIERKVPDALFSMELEYERNGNIESSTWKSTYHLHRQYAYSYDALNRISSADYSILPSPGVPMPTYGKGFTADNFTYDALGNILSLTRYAQLVPNTEAVLIDDLRYQYHASLNPGEAAIPNQVVTSRPDVSRLITIEEKGETDFAKDNGFEPGAAVIGDDYGYDSAGTTLIDDPYKGIAITYNHLNLPEEIDGIKILYDASGRKWAMEYPDGTIRLYIAGMEFVDGVFESLNLSDGRIYTETGNNGRPSALLAEYWHKDHLGNIRVSFADQNGDRLVQLLDNGSGNASEVNQILDYYPFGLQHPGQLCAPEVEPENAYRYNGKELLEDVGLYDYGARYYDPAVGRWNAVDPLADSYAPWSAYNYVMGNPLRFIDPDGMQVDDIIIKPKRNDGTRFSPRTLATLQRLTNDQLGFASDGRTVTIVERRTGNLTEGTNPIRDLIGDTENNVEITNDVSGKRNSRGERMSESNLLRNAFTTADFEAAASNGHGTGSTIFFSPDVKASATLEDGTTETADASIVLGHELVHADNNRRGEREAGTPPSDPSFPASREEEKAFHRENLIREQMGMKKRKVGDGH